MNIKYSIVIPYYDDIEYIHQCLMSLVKQTYNNFQVVLVDDFSTDSIQLEEMLTKEFYDLLDIKYIRNDENLNGAHSRNIGVNNSCGDYICFLDADDYWLDTKLEDVTEYIISNKLSSRDVIYSMVNLIQSSDIIGVRPKLAMNRELHMSEYLFLAGGFIQTSTLVVPMALSKIVKFDERFKRHQDYQYCLSLAEFAEFHLIPKPLVNYRVPNGLYGKRADDVDFCEYWLKEVRCLMSTDGYYGYRLFAFNARLFYGRQYVKMLSNTAGCLFNLSIKGYKTSFGKLKSVFASF